jgi:hypothetical protein
MRKAIAILMTAGLLVLGGAWSVGAADPTHGNYSDGSGDQSLTSEDFNDGVVDQLIPDGNGQGQVGQAATVQEANGAKVDGKHDKVGEGTFRDIGDVVPVVG